MGIVYNLQKLYEAYKKRGLIAPFFYYICCLFSNYTSSNSFPE